MVQQGYRKDQPRDTTRQGIYAATAGGQLLASDHFHPSPERMLAMLRGAQERWKQTPRTEVAVNTVAGADDAYLRKPPAGGLILNVFSRIPLPPPPDKAWTPNSATGRDHLWLTEDEWRSLLPKEWRDGARYPVPPDVAHRLLRFHLVDNVRGEPDMWRRQDIRRSDLTLRVEDAGAGRLALEGAALMAHGDARGYEARIQGYLTYDRKQDRLTRFDLLSWGQAWGEGTYTKSAPPGRFPLVIAASLAGDSPADRVPPQASRQLREYLGTGE